MAKVWIPFSQVIRRAGIPFPMFERECVWWDRLDV